MPITSSSRPVSSAKDCCSPSPSHIPGSSGPPSDPGCAPSDPGSRLPNSSSQPRYASGFLNFSWIPRNTTSSRNSSPNERIPIKCRASDSQLEKNSGKTPDSQVQLFSSSSPPCHSALISDLDGRPPSFQ